MGVTDFGAMFNKLKMPVIVCGDSPDFPVVFMNTDARLLFAPSAGNGRNGGENALLRDALRFHRKEEWQVFVHSLTYDGTVQNLDAGVYSYQDEILQARINANAGSIGGFNGYFVYVADYPAPERRSRDGLSNGGYMTRILKASHSITDLDDAINTILGLAGMYAKVSRAYIFEDLPDNYTCNTHEWCADGVEPAMQVLQRLYKPDYIYGSIMDASGMVITDDIEKLPPADRDILAKQGIKALAILPLYHFDKPLGFLGFDDCENNRKWSMEEIRFLGNVASVLSGLINRRNAERDSRRSREIVRTVTDNLDDLVYINDLETYELKFISKSLARAVHKPVESILGQPCWKILHRNQSGPCAFCPIPKLRERGPHDGSGPYVWELHSSVTGKWYLVRDSLIKWVDDRPAHLCTYVDITYRKQYEEQLRRFAATDAMTNVYNRKWGYDKLQKLFHLPVSERERMTLCFVDIDDLKQVNDRFGHAAGDEMIVNTVQTIFACVRKNDIIARWGGDEFVLLLDCRMADAGKVMDKIEFGLAHFNLTGGKPYELSISYGLVEFASPSLTLDEIIAEADKRMYARKAEKKAMRNV